MKEVTGDLWSYYGRKDTVICITTNGFTKKDGKGVMGRGCAKEARDRIRGIEAELGKSIAQFGNTVQWLNNGKILSFPVKHKFWETADLALIRESVDSLKQLAESPSWNASVFILPRPGCGAGGLLWEHVKPLLLELPDNVRVISPPVLGRPL